MQVEGEKLADKDMNKHEKVASKGLTRSDILKFGVLVIILVASIVITVAFWPYIMQLTSQEGIEELVGTVREAGPLAVGALLLLQLLQVIIAFIPGEVVQVAAGMLYGPLWGSVIILVGACLSTILIYYLVRRLGTPFVSKMVPREMQEKLGFVSDTARLEIIVFALFLIPGLPKDIITYVIALTAIKPSRFFLLSTVGRVPGVVVSSFAGHTIAEGNWIVFIVLAVVALAVIALVYFNRDKIFNRLGEASKQETSKQEIK